jgi:hypothetical protein
MSYLPRISTFGFHHVGYYVPSLDRHVITSTHPTEGGAREAVVSLSNEYRKTLRCWVFNTTRKIVLGY